MSGSAVGIQESSEDLAFRSPGRVTCPASPGTPGRTFVCNTTGHCIDVLGDDGEPLFSFGEFGNGEGQLNEPADVALVFLRSRRSADGMTRPSGQVVVVADRGNHRLQMFGLDGTPLATVDPWRARSRRVDVDDRSGWPFFRINPLPQLVLPSMLEWRSPFLFVTVGDRDGDGDVVVIDLELALLPDFRTWLKAAPTVVVRDALNDSLRRATRDQLPDSLLWAMHHRVRSELRLVRNAYA